MVIFDVVVNTPSVASERVDGEVIVISNESGKYYSLGHTASDIWFLIQNSVSASLWLKILAGNYEGIPDYADNEIEIFLNLMVEEKLIRRSNSSSLETVVLPQDIVHRKWTAPEMLIFEDLKDLLLVDPIHDSSEEGWPFVPKD
jgi:hypothetical protein